MTASSRSRPGRVARTVLPRPQKTTNPYLFFVGQSLTLSQLGQIRQAIWVRTLQESEQHGDDQRRAFDAGYQMHLAKPVSFEQILLAIGGVYRRSAGASGASAVWRLDEARRNGARLPVTALVDQFYADVQKMGGGRWDTSSLIRRLR